MRFPKHPLRAIALAAVLAAAPAALAGPPLLCQPIEIADAASLPWDGGNWGATPGHEPQAIVDRTLALLTPELPTLARMETLRRATVYLGNLEGGDGFMNRLTRDTTFATQLLAKLEERAARPGSGRAAALARFDAGYLAACYAEAGLGSRGMGLPRVEEALALAPDDGAMHLAAALMCLHPRRDAFQQHLTAAAKLAPEGSLLAANIEANGRRWRWPPLAELRRDAVARVP